MTIVYGLGGENNQGTAVLSSLCSLDREKQKEYLIPILITDSGKPAMTGTSTLTVVVGDINDHKMEPGSKEILVYNYMARPFNKTNIYIKIYYLRHHRFGLYRVIENDGPNFISYNMCSQHNFFIFLQNT